MMNSRSSQPADLLSPSLCPTSLQKSLMSSRKTLRTFQGFWFKHVGNKWEMVLKKRSGRMRRRIMKSRVALSHVNPPSLHGFLQFGKVRNTKTSNLPGNQSSILLLPLNFLFFCQRPYNLPETSHMTSHTSHNRFIHILYLSSLGAI